MYMNAEPQMFVKRYWCRKERKYLISVVKQQVFTPQHHLLQTRIHLSFNKGQKD